MHLTHKHTYTERKGPDAAHIFARYTTNANRQLYNLLLYAYKHQTLIYIQKINSMKTRTWIKCTVFISHTPALSSVSFSSSLFHVVVSAQTLVICQYLSNKKPAFRFVYFVLHCCLLISNLSQVISSDKYVTSICKNMFSSVLMYYYGYRNTSEIFSVKRILSRDQHDTPPPKKKCLSSLNDSDWNWQ